MTTLTLTEAMRTRAYWHLSRSTDGIGLSDKTSELLVSQSIWRVYDLARTTEQTLLNNKGFTRGMLSEVKDILREMNLSLNLTFAEDLCLALKIPFIPPLETAEEIGSARSIKMPTRKALIRQRKLINYRLKHYDAILAGTMPHTPPKT